MIQSNDLKAKLKNRERIFGGWISFDHPGIAEIFALSGVDFIGLDMEHAPISLESAQNLIARIQSLGVSCLPRPVSHSNDYFKPLMDSGADGLIVQMVQSAEDVKNIVHNVKFPPLGGRTFGVNRAHGYGLNFDSYLEEWNQKSTLIVQIESKNGVENIEEIISNDQVDGVMIGPYDLSGSYGYPGKIDHQEVIQGAKKVIKACEKYNKSCGTQLSKVDKNNVKYLFDQGYTFVILSSDLFLLADWSIKIKKLINSY